MIFFGKLQKSAPPKPTRRPPFFISLFDRVLKGQSNEPNHICADLLRSENPGLVTSCLASKMADRKWPSDFRFGLWRHTTKEHFLSKCGRRISSSFGDTDRKVEFSNSLPAAILDFFEKQNYTCRLIFRALSNAVVRFRIGPIGAEKKLPKISYLSAQVT